ncbi:MAG: hypothetical protein E7600_02790 [Ruminococcaceae bacterium]|nr:hypothetical protein [Oscillospiraceae bacterium]
MTELLPLICESIRDGGQFVFYPTGISMLPTVIPNEDCVVLVEPKNIKKYDLILFTRPNGKYVLHRIINIKNGEYIIKGDNQNWTEKTTIDKVIAKVSEVRKKDGSVINYNKLTSKVTVAKLESRKFVKRVINKIKRMLKGKK